MWYLRRPLCTDYDDCKPPHQTCHQRLPSVEVMCLHPLHHVASLTFPPVDLGWWLHTWLARVAQVPNLGPTLPLTVGGVGFILSAADFDWGCLRFLKLGGFTFVKRNYVCQNVGLPILHSLISIKYFKVFAFYHDLYPNLQPMYFCSNNISWIYWSQSTLRFYPRMLILFILIIMIVDYKFWKGSCSNFWM